VKSFILGEKIVNKQTQEKQSKEYRNFAELTRNLLAVPKKEIDRKKAAYARKKKEKPAK
jgi:putative ubiquitin-RnfH superfamily antitoxin RatB of RatAB toxin-antitoxin module